ncbi:MAG: hypothetical protein ACJ8ER_06475 [Allosphingosinicella sp.]
MILIVVAITAAATTFLVHLFQGPLFGEGYSVSYADFLVIVLTALAIMITVLAIFLAALGIIGWATFEAKLRDTSLAYFTSQLGKDGPLRSELEALLVQISLSGVEKRDTPPKTEAPEQPKDVPYND